MSNAAKLFLTLFFSYAFFTNSYLTTNDASRFSLTAAIVEEGSFEITNILPQVLPRQAEGWVPRDFAKVGNRFYSDKAPLGSFIAIPSYFIITRLSRSLPVVVYFVSLMTAGLLSALAGVAVYKTGKLFNAGERLPLAAALTYGLCSMALFYGQIFFSGGITAFFTAAAFYLLVKRRLSPGGTYESIAAGVCIACSVMSDYYAGISAAVLLVYSWKSPKEFARTAAAFAIALCPLLFYNNAVFGSPFETGYRYSYLSAALHGKGFYGLTAPDAKGLLNLGRMLFARWGFFFTNLPVVFSLVYFSKFFARQRKEGIAIAAMLAGYLYLNTSLGWFDAYSARFFMPILPLLFLPLVTLPVENRVLRNTFFFIAGFSLMINLAGTDFFMPQIKSLAHQGEQNLFGQWLAARGRDTGFFTFLPLFLMWVVVWLLPARQPSKPELTLVADGGDGSETK